MSERVREPGWTLSGEWVFQWPQWWRMREYNWVNFYPLQIGIEAGEYKGRYVEVECVVLGIGFRLEAYERVSRQWWAEEMEQRMEDAKASETLFLLEDCEECDGVGSVFVEKPRNGLDSAGEAR